MILLSKRQIDDYILETMEAQEIDVKDINWEMNYSNRQELAQSFIVGRYNWWININIAKIIDAIIAIAYVREMNITNKDIYEILEKIGFTVGQIKEG